MVRFTLEEIQYLKHLFYYEIYEYKVHIGNYVHPVFHKDNKLINNLIENHSLEQLLNILFTFEQKYKYILPSKNGKKEDLATMIYNLNHDPFFYNTPFELLPKYSLFNIETYPVTYIKYICKQFNIDFDQLKCKNSNITSIQRLNFISICKKLNIIIN